MPRYLNKSTMETCWLEIERVSGITFLNRVNIVFFVVKKETMYSPVVNIVYVLLKLGEVTVGLYWLV